MIICTNTLLVNQVKNAPLMLVNQKDSDRIFRDINIEVNKFLYNESSSILIVKIRCTGLVCGMVIEKETQR